MAGYSEYQEQSRDTAYQLLLTVHDIPNSGRLESVIWPRVFTSYQWAIDKAVQMVNENPLIRAIEIQQITTLGTTVD